MVVVPDGFCCKYMNEAPAKGRQLSFSKARSGRVATPRRRKLICIDLAIVF